MTSLVLSTLPGVQAQPAHAMQRAHLWAEAPIGDDEMYALRRNVVLESSKWDPQVGDNDTLCRFPLVLKATEWKKLARLAENLSAEAIAAESEISDRPELLAQLGFPHRLLKVMMGSAALTPSADRVMRFDFHPTTEGWRISEVNSDVPGGFTEASYFTARVARYFPRLRPAGNPGRAWSDALSEAFERPGVIGLLSAPGYMEDHQVIAYLARELHTRGWQTHLAKPEQIVWRDGIAHLETAWHAGPLDLILKFHQAEWLCRLPRKCRWKQFFRGGRTPVANPPLAIITESKRFPLVWDQLSVPLPNWRALLPESRDPRRAAWSKDDCWLLKTAMCNNGDTVCVRQFMRRGDWLRTRVAVNLSPSRWVAQRRFESNPVSTPDGPRHACIGVYTVNGRTAGAYARLSEKSVIDFSAADVALLVDANE